MKKNKLLVWIGLGSAILIGGGLFWYFKNKKDQEAELEKQPEKELEKEPEKEPIKSSPEFTFPFKTVEEGNAFRAWVNDKFPDYAKEIELARQGTLNSFVQKAWDKLGTDYLKRDEKKSTDSQSTEDVNFDAAIDQMYNTLIKENVPENSISRFRATKNSVPQIAISFYSKKDGKNYAVYNFRWFYFTKDGKIQRTWRVTKKIIENPETLVLGEGKFSDGGKSLTTNSGRVITSNTLSGVAYKFVG